MPHLFYQPLLLVAEPQPQRPPDPGRNAPQWWILHIVRVSEPVRVLNEVRWAEIGLMPAHRRWLLRGDRDLFNNLSAV